MSWEEEVESCSAWGGGQMTYLGDWGYEETMNVMLDTCRKAMESSNSARIIIYLLQN